MKRYFMLIMFICISTYLHSQDGNHWNTYFENAIKFYESKEYVAAEKQFKKSQQSLIEEYGLNDTTIPTYCHILYRRAHNLFLIDELVDSAYLCFKELHGLSKISIDSVSGNLFRIESAIILSFIDLERGNIKACCELLESEKQIIDELDTDSHLQHKYFYYKNLAKVYEYVIVNLLSGKEQKFEFLESDYVIVRDGLFYKNYIAVYNELVNLSFRYNKDNKIKITEDLLLLANHCRIPDDDYLAEKTFERAFSLWENDKDHNNISYLKLCKDYLAHCNKSSMIFQKDIIAKEFDIIVLRDSSLSYIDAMDLYSVRLQDKSLSNTQREKYIKKLSDEIIRADNYTITYIIIDNRGLNDALSKLINRKILIKYLSLAAMYYYEQGDITKADILLNKAKFFSLVLPVGDRLLLEELNNAIAISAEIIGDKETFYNYKTANFTCNLARGIIPTIEDWLLVSNYGDVETRITKIKDGILFYSNEQYDKSMLEFYLKLAEAYLEKGNYSIAHDNIVIVDSIIKSMERDGDTLSNLVMSEFLLNKARYALYKGDISNAIKFAKKSNEKTNNIMAVDLLAELYKKDEREVEAIVNNQFSRTKNFIQESYPFLSERERIVHSQGDEFLWLANLPKYADYYPNDTTLLSLAYNSALISKGTNMNLYTLVINKARESKKKNTKEVLDNYIQQKNYNVNDTCERVRNNRDFYIEILEKEMQLFSGVSSDFFDKHIGNWKEISKQLAKNEIAIEFVEYVPLNMSETNNRFLGALYITSNRHPKIVKLCKLTDIERFKSQIKHDGLSDIYNVIWNPILRENHNISRIWFSPSEHLFQINIEAALPDSIIVYRVSSTRNLLDLNDVADYSGIALFGGLNYDTNNNFKSDEIQNHIAQHIIRDSKIDEERVGLAYLKGSLEEVVSAQKILSSLNQNIQMFVDQNGTEESFKNLSGRGLSLLHIATHGFYINNTNKVSNIGTRIMRKSGLFMSGAKTIWKGTNEEYFGDDGILLSEEIENLDFSKLNLVVLSACGTGLGSPSNDGVYGLQRAFKKAGAQTIIMSLWSVDDNTTALMMKTFYKELVRTNSKHKAFQNAQNVLRKTYDNPYYWAAFIMLD